MNKQTLMNSSVFDPPSDFVIYPNVRTSIVAIGLFSLVASAVGLSILWIYLRTATSPLTSHIRFIVFSSLIGVVMGE